MAKHFAPVNPLSKFVEPVSQRQKLLLDERVAGPAMGRKKILQGLGRKESKHCAV